MAATAIKRQLRKFFSTGADERLQRATLYSKVTKLENSLTETRALLKQQLEYVHVLKKELGSFHAMLQQRDKYFWQRQFDYSQTGAATVNYTQNGNNIKVTLNVVNGNVTSVTSKIENPKQK